MRRENDLFHNITLSYGIGVVKSRLTWKIKMIGWHFGERPHFQARALDSRGLVVPAVIEELAK
jgi:hypothetical protein